MSTITYTVNSGSIIQTNNAGDNKIQITGNINVEKDDSFEKDKQQSPEEGKMVKFKKWFYRQLSKHFLIGIIIILLGVIIFNQFYQIDDANNITIVLAFVGIAVTFVVVSNYAQVKDVESKFESKVKDVENLLPSIESKYKTVISAMVEFQKGYLFEDKSIALSCYMRSLKILNSVRDNEITNIVISSIDGLKRLNDIYKETENKRISISSIEKSLYSEILMDSNNQSSVELIDWINNLPISPIKDIVEEVVVQH